MSRSTWRERLANHLPMGMTVVSVEPATGRQAASRVEAVTYRVEVADDVDWDAALAALRGGRDVRGRAHRAEQGVEARRRPPLLHARSPTSRERSRWSWP